MANNTIQFVIKAIDQTRAAFNSATNRIKNFAQGSMNFLKRLGNMAKWAMLGITAGITLAIREYLNYSRAVAKLDVALSKNNRQNEINKKTLLELADSLQKTAGVEDEAVINAEAILLSYKKLSGDVIPKAIKAIVDMNTAMTDGDVSMGGLQASAVMLGRSLSDPKKAITMLARAGVILDKEQKRAIKSALAHKDASKAQAVILDALEEKYGGMAEAIMKSQQGVDRVKGSFGDLVKEIGRVILVGFGFEKGMKGISEAIDDFTDSGKISQWGSNIVGWFKSALKSAEELRKLLIDIFSDEEGKFDLIGGIKSIGAAIGSGLLRSIPKIAETFARIAAETLTLIFPKLQTRTPEEQIKEKTRRQYVEDYRMGLKGDFIKNGVDAKTAEEMANRMAEGKGNHMDYTAAGIYAKGSLYDKIFGDPSQYVGEKEFSKIYNTKAYGGAGGEDFYEKYAAYVKEKANKQRKIEEDALNKQERMEKENREKRRREVLKISESQTLKGIIDALEIGEKALSKDAATKRLSGYYGLDLESMRKDLDKARTEQRDANTPILEEIRDNLVAK